MAQVTDISGSSGAAANAPASPAVTETANRAHQVVRDAQPVLTISGGRGRPTVVEYRLPDGTVTDRNGAPIQRDVPSQTPPQPSEKSLESAGRTALNILQQVHEASQTLNSPEIGKSRAEQQRTHERQAVIAAEESEQQTEQPGFFARTYGAVSGAVSAPIQTVRNWWNGESEENTNEPRVYDEGHRSAMEYSLDTADNFGLSALDQARVLKSSHDYLIGKEE